MFWKEEKMRHIPGSTFINNTTRYGKFLKRGVCYRLINIKPSRGEDNSFLYVFDTSDGQKEITFASIKEADDFLSNFVI